VLKGGWGDAFEKFRPVVDALPPARRRQVDLLDYVKDMRSAYRASRAVLFPSFEEGYGMTAVEAMYCGVPVVSSNYPAILEAVGDGARTLCPYKNKPEQWISAINEVLSNQDEWARRALARADFLAQRQGRELAELMDFLSGKMD
jgi:glycosyltransferase involved in cell wall biosynthesis